MPHIVVSLSGTVWYASQTAPIFMDIEVILSGCLGPDSKSHKCTGRKDKFWSNGDNAVCTCECHKK